MKVIGWETLAMLAGVASACTVLGAVPPNDAFANRIPLTGTNLTVTGWNTNATKEPAEPNHAGNAGGQSVWWMWTAPTQGEVNITTDGSDFDTLLGVYAGSTLPSLTLVASSDDHGLLPTGRVRFQVLAGTNLKIAVDGFNEAGAIASGNITLHLSFLSEPILRPPNDHFSNRVAVAGTRLDLVGSNVLASREADEPTHAGSAGDTSIWWSWTAPASGPVVLSTFGSNFDTLLGVYRGTRLSTLVTVAANDDIDPLSAILTSSVLFNANAGTTYHIAVDGFDGASGTVALRLDTPVPILTGPQRLADGAFRFNVSGVPGRTYEIQASDNLDVWSMLGTVFNSNGVVSFIDPEIRSPGNRSYRAVLQP
jgi:hypothetical protein